MNLTLPSASTAQISIPELIDRYCEPSPKEKGKFICPACGGGNLQHKSSGKWNCWNDPSSEHRSDIARILNGQLHQENPQSRNGTPPPRRKSDRQIKQEQHRAKEVQAAVSLTEVEMKVEELTCSYDPAFGISPAKLTAEIAAWAKAHGHDVYAAKMLLKEKLRPIDRISSEDDQCKLARSFHKIKAVWGDRLQYNERTSDAELSGEPIDLDSARVELAVEQNIQCGIEDFQSVVMSIAKQQSYDPVAQYLTTVARQHQGTDILEGLANRYFGTTAPIYETFIRKTLIAAAARVFQPGCNVQHALILQGPQGYFKSTFFKTLCGEQFFDDTMGSANDKDERLKLHRFWFIEWAELEALFRRKDISTVKAFITTAYDNIRPPYGRQTATFHRRSIIVGTTNEDDFLRDPTGNRRFWVIPVQKSIPIDLLEQERDQIWAAAVHAYRAGEQWHMDRDEAAIAAEVASEFEDYDPWESYIEQWIEDTYRETYETNEILERVFQLEPGEIDRKQQMRVAHCMKKLGWEKSCKGKGRKRIWSKKISFLGLKVDQVDHPNSEVLIYKGSEGDQPGDQRGDQPLFEVDHPVEVDRLKGGGDQPQGGGDQPQADRLITHETLSPGGSLGGAINLINLNAQTLKEENLNHFFNVGDKVEIRQSGQFFGKQVFVTKTQHRRNRYEVKGKDWFIARMFDRADLKLVKRSEGES